MLFAQKRVTDKIYTKIHLTSQQGLSQDNGQEVTSLKHKNKKYILTEVPLTGLTFGSD
jgi:hypothetical protein